MLTVRELQQSDIEHITNYWLQSDTAFLEGMGVDVAKMPNRDQWREMLSAQLEQSYETKQSYAIIWESEGEPVGHCNVNKIQFGEVAYMHLHLWPSSERRQGMGTAFVKMTLPFFFTNLELKTIYCEPYAFNPAPNKTLGKLGFQFVRQYSTTPGRLNFEQEVNLWSLDRERFLQVTNQ